MVWESWLVIRRDNGRTLGAHIVHRARATESRLRDAVDAWSGSGPVCLFNTTTSEVYY